MNTSCTLAPPHTSCNLPPPHTPQAHCPPPHLSCTLPHQHLMHPNTHTHLKHPPLPPPCTLMHPAPPHKSRAPCNLPTSCTRRHAADRQAPHTHRLQGCLRVGMCCQQNLDHLFVALFRRDVQACRTCLHRFMFFEGFEVLGFGVYRF